MMIIREQNDTYSIENRTDFITAFLRVLDENMLLNRDSIVSLNPALWQQVCQLTSDIDIDLDAKLEGEE